MQLNATEAWRNLSSSSSPPNSWSSSSWPTLCHLEEGSFGHQSEAELTRCLMSRHWTDPLMFHIQPPPLNSSSYWWKWWTFEWLDLIVEWRSTNYRLKMLMFMWRWLLSPTTEVGGILTNFSSIISRSFSIFCSKFLSILIMLKMSSQWKWW